MSLIEDGGAVEAGRTKLVERLRNAPFPNGWTQHPETLDIAEVVLDAADQIESDAAEITRLRAENAGMREALEFYGDPAGWNQPPVKTYEGLISVEYENQASKIQKDRGRVARAALSKASQAEGQTR